MAAHNNARSSTTCRGISPWVGDSPPRLWDLPGSPLIRVLPGAPRLCEEPHRSPHEVTASSSAEALFIGHPPAVWRASVVVTLASHATAPGQLLTAARLSCSPLRALEEPPHPRRANPTWGSKTRRRTEEWLPCAGLVPAQRHPWAREELQRRGVRAIPPLVELQRRSVRAIPPAVIEATGHCYPPGRVSTQTTRLP